VSTNDVDQSEQPARDDGPSTRSREPLPSLLGDGGLVGESPAMRKLGELLTRVAALDATVLIQGRVGRVRISSRGRCMRVVVV
jgi:DNA-binding NtrC family response regulator